MTCADQTMIRRAAARADHAGRFPRIIAGLLRLVRLPGSRGDNLSDHMLRDVGVTDGRLTEERMRRDLMHGRAFDHLRF